MPSTYAHATLEDYQRHADFMRKLNDFVHEHDPNGLKCPNDGSALVNVSPLVDGTDYRCRVCSWTLVEGGETI